MKIVLITPPGPSTRTGNSVAAPLQNARSRYRVRINTDKEIDPKFKFHFQLSTAPANNGITNDQDMAGIDVKLTVNDLASETVMVLRTGKKKYALLRFTNT